MDPQADRKYFALGAGVKVLPLPGDEPSVLFRSPAVALRLEGPSATFFADKVLPLLDGRRTVEDVAAALPDIGAGDLREHLESLADAKVLTCRDAPGNGAGTGPHAALDDLLDGLGLPAGRARERLSSMRVVLAGLGDHGGLLADLLARFGIGAVVVADPWASDRETAVRSWLESRPASPRIEIAETDALDRSAVRQLADGADFLFGCFGEALPAADHWVNRAAHDTGVPAMFGRLEGHRALIGPVVIPDETACLMCWRMRYLACADDFAEAMAYEEHLDGLRQPADRAASAIPSLGATLAGMMATEFLKTALALGVPALAGNVIEYDALKAETRSHPVLRRPDCPVCGKKKDLTASQPALDELPFDQPPGDVLTAADRLVSPHCGVVRTFERIHKDPWEPEKPYIFRAELSNARFLDAEHEPFIVASGKGMTLDAARGSALGEAVERYASCLWSDDIVTHARRRDLDGPSLDPRRLVLFRPEQYAGLKYDAYDEDSLLGWVECRSLGTGEAMMVPALAVVMAYDALQDEGFLFPITSNGLAAGRTLTDAILSAALEVVERDAFLNLWLHRLPATKVDPFTLPDPDIVGLCAAYRRRGVAMELYRVPVDHGVHVFIGMAVEPEPDMSPAVVVGLGADYDPVAAARSAILEVAQVRPALRMRLRRDEAQARMAELVADPAKVTTLDDHDLLYADPAMLGSFDFLRRRPVEAFDWDAGTPPDTETALRRLVGELREQGTDLLYRDLTTEDVAGLGVHVVRAVIPDYQPMHFGRGERRLAAERLYRMPRLLGLRADDAGVADLNDDPHPLA